MRDFFLFFLNLVTAIHSEDFLKDLTDEIYNDCQGKDLEIKEGFIINTLTEENITSLKAKKWNYNDLSEIVKILDQHIYVTYTMVPCDGVGSMGSGVAAQGCGILKCENHRLDISGDVPYWDIVKFEEKKEVKVTYGADSDIIETHGDKSPATGGDNSPINQKETNIWVQLFLSKGTIAGAIIGFILKILYDYLKKRKEKKSSSKKPESPE